MGCFYFSGFIGLGFRFCYIVVVCGVRGDGRVERGVYVVVESFCIDRVELWLAFGV